jgi:hypothetical protein
MLSYQTRLQGVLKNDLKHLLLKAAEIRRIHLIGCSRTEVTMLHYALIAFRNTFLFEKETFPWNDPEVKACWTLWKDWRFNLENRFFITKRHANWWQPHFISALAHYAQRYRIFIINIIRDPRDVLTDRHLDDHPNYYVTPELWRKSMVATRQLQRELAGYPHIMTIKYEEVILHPHRIEQQLQQAFGLRLRPEVGTWSRLKQNLEEINVAGHVLPYMHKLHDFDESSLAKWQRDPIKAEYVDFLLTKSKYRDRLKTFMAEHGYHYAETRLRGAMGHDLVGV